jgi:NAD+ kinase
LRIAPRCAENNIPALGINLGTIGFLTEVEITDIEAALSCVLKGEYITEKRMLLKVRINDEKTAYHALNDVVMLKPDRLKLINIDLYSNSELVFRYRADGLIIATPTGSTGYSVSAGGPVVDPSMQLYIATPICAHMLGARSAVLSSDKELVLRLSESNTETGAIISTDGEQQRIISTDDKVRISKSDYEFELIKIGKTSFYNTLIDKLS